MTENASLEVRKQELTRAEGGELTRARRVFVPRTDIYEDGKQITVVADMPGVDEKSVDITLEKNTLTIRGFAREEKPENGSLLYSEYVSGDFERSFIVSSEVDRDKIAATVKDGVLTLRLPKAPAAVARKIEIKKG